MKCPEGKIYKDGSCIDINSCVSQLGKFTNNGFECVSECGSGYVNFLGTCIPSCTGGKAVNPINFKCVSQCPVEYPNVLGTDVKICARTTI